MHSDLRGILDVIEAEPDPVVRFLLATRIRDFCNEHITRMRQRAAYEGARDTSLTAFAESTESDRAVVTAAAQAHMERLGLPDFRKRSQLDRVEKFSFSRPHRPK